MNIRFEFKLEDVWVGVFWAKKWEFNELGNAYWHVWVCLLPCLPVHFWWRANT